LQCRENVFNLPRLKVASHGILDFKLLLLLIKLPTNNILVDGIDDKVFKLSNRRHFKGFEEIGIGQDLIP
jgi:hypothetical protein